MTDTTRVNVERLGTPRMRRRAFVRLLGWAFGLTATGALAACAPATGEPEIQFVYPRQGVRVPSTQFTVQLAVRNFRLVRPAAPRPGEGHLHLFINVPASDIPDGQIIPLDQKDKYIHLGAPPFTSRVLTLPPGVHTLTAVMADGLHAKLAVPIPVSVTFLVQP
jgi:hypothetical protein